MAPQTILRSFLKSLGILTQKSQSSSGTEGPEVLGSESPFYVVSVIGWFSKTFQQHLFLLCISNTPSSNSNDFNSMLYKI